LLFNSIEFLIFFPIVTILYFLLPHKWRWLLLLLASCMFYMAFIPVYIFVLFATIIVDYSAGLLMERSIGRRRQIYLVVSIVFTIAILFVFKYFNFFNTNIALIANFFHWNYPIEALKIILPIGLSFHTFQSMSYVIEVYRGKQKVERNFGIYALYVMFYPQLVAGPIERPQNLLHQFYEPHYFEYQRAIDSLKLMIWGLFKKVVIADRLAILVNHIYGNPSGYTGIPLIVATLFFAIQIYCDFSGYSDIAIGSAQFMGFKLMDNFNRPYFSKSIAEFWKRWHISLSTWFRDYLYIPLGGNRVSNHRWYYNLFITFLISGLWHGANWTYIIWGALNGFYLIFGIWTEKIREKAADLIGLSRYPLIYKYTKVAITFSLVCFAWIFFRASNVFDALYIISHILSGTAETIRNMISGDYAVARSLLVGKGLGLPINEILLGSLFTALLIAFHYIQRHGSIRHMLSEKPIYFRWAAYYLIVITILVFGVFNKSQFIYFQF